MHKTFRRAFTLIELLVVVLVITILIALLLAGVQSVRHSAISKKLAYEFSSGGNREFVQVVETPAQAGKKPSSLPQARVKTFVANVALTPRLSVGTAAPESIYEAKFTGKIQAELPEGTKGDCELELPLPPQIISLADLSIKVDDKSSENVILRSGKLVWQGPLPNTPTALEITYTAVGKGLYELAVPPGGIVDRFQITLGANGSDVRLLELSLQPTKVEHTVGSTIYIWNYERLLFGRPLRLDVLGIAPIDRLGELTWLGPISVIVFGLLVGLVVHATEHSEFDRWMLLLTVGTFAGAYPLMYFAQEYISLEAAVLASSGIALLIIGVRTVTLMGVKLALFGVVLPAAIILAITLVADVVPRLQGILLTAEALGFFIVAMMLMPKLRLALALPEVRKSEVKKGDASISEEKQKEKADEGDATS